MKQHSDMASQSCPLFSRRGRWRGSLSLSWAARAAAMGALLLVVSGCNRGTQPTPPADRPRPHSTATLEILEPPQGAVVTGLKVRVRLALRGGRLIPETTTRLVPDEGHIHLLVDGKLVSMLYGLDQEVEVTPGTHLLQAEYVANDHFPFNPRVIVVATFLTH